MVWSNKLYTEGNHLHTKNIFSKEISRLYILCQVAIAQKHPQIRRFSAKTLHFGGFLIPENRQLLNFYLQEQPSCA